jgi:hypothetical protein
MAQIGGILTKGNELFGSLDNTLLYLREMKGHD